MLRAAEAAHPAVGAPSENFFSFGPVLAWGTRPANVATSSIPFVRPEISRQLAERPLTLSVYPDPLQWAVGAGADRRLSKKEAEDMVARYETDMLEAYARIVLAAASTQRRVFTSREVGQGATCMDNFWRLAHIVLQARTLTAEEQLYYLAAITYSARAVIFAAEQNGSWAAGEDALARAAHPSGEPGPKMAQSGRKEKEKHARPSGP
jgi:hypothetical protein